MSVQFTITLRNAFINLNESERETVGVEMSNQSESFPYVSRVDFSRGSRCDSFVRCEGYGGRSTATSHGACLGWGIYFCVAARESRETFVVYSRSSLPEIDRSVIVRGWHIGGSPGAVLHLSRLAKKMAENSTINTRVAFRGIRGDSSTFLL